MASEMAKAYNEIFTVSFITGRSVGIGAYLIRLGQRVVQKNDSPILLTGFNALNKILGDSIYSSNLQIGGPNIMAFCGISHKVVNTDLEGITECLRWTAFSQPFHQSINPSFPVPPKDPVGRKVAGFLAETALKDPRAFLSSPGGLFDEGSFWECQRQWARSVMVGRARLGGVPVGVISPEGSVTEKTVLADPALIESRECVVPQAGNVWFPDSAQKTATAIRDFNKEKLPLFILANWRGFSGGMKDMFDEVLKFGANIVYSLIDYTSPVFIYLPPHAELRGGSWVVLDSLINKAHIEIYASGSARAGVLEPEGTLDVKLKTAKLADLAARLQKSPTEEPHSAAIDPENAGKRAFSLSREVGLRFAELHDTAQRMEAVGVVRRLVQFEVSRKFFYWRLRYRLKRREVTECEGNALPHVATEDERREVLDDEERLTVLERMSGKNDEGR